MQNQSNPKRARFNLIDVLIVLSVIALVVSAVIRSQSSLAPGTKQQTVKAEVQALIQNLSVDLFDSIASDEVMFLQDGTVLGVLRKADFRKAAYSYIGDDGALVITESDTNYDVSCLLEAEGVSSDHGFLLNGEHYLAPGQTLTVKTTRLTVEILITDIKAFQNS